jgi:hypothetical protein
LFYTLIDGYHYFVIDIHAFKGETDAIGEGRHGMENRLYWKKITGNGGGRGGGGGPVG